MVRRSTDRAGPLPAEVCPPAPATDAAINARPAAPAWKSLKATRASFVHIARSAAHHSRRPPPRKRRPAKRLQRLVESEGAPKASLPVATGRPAADQQCLTIPRRVPQSVPNETSPWRMAISLAAHEPNVPGNSEMYE